MLPNLVADVTDVALEWAERNVKNNPHISELVEVRKVTDCQETLSIEDPNNAESVNGKNRTDMNGSLVESGSFTLPVDAYKNYHGPPILVGVVRDNEKFDFCMCNPPFFETMEEAGLNPKTSCGGTPMEMVCPGGEKAFISTIIEDSVVLKESFRFYSHLCLSFFMLPLINVFGYEVFVCIISHLFHRWFTSMVGRKANLKFLISKLRDVGVTVVKTTEFVQGQTCRWGLAWSFVPPSRKIISPYVAGKSILSFMLEVWILFLLSHT